MVSALRFGLYVREAAYAIATDSNDNVLLTGSVIVLINFGGGSLSGNGNYNVFVAKLSSSGAHAWLQRFAGSLESRDRTKVKYFLDAHAAKGTVTTADAAVQSSRGQLAS